MQTIFKITQRNVPWLSALLEDVLKRKAITLLDLVKLYSQQENPKTFDEFVEATSRRKEFAANIAKIGLNDISWSFFCEVMTLIGEPVTLVIGRSDVTSDPFGTPKSVPEETTN